MSDLANSLERLFALGDEWAKRHPVDREVLDEMLEHRPTDEDIQNALREHLEVRWFDMEGDVRVVEFGPKEDAAERSLRKRLERKIRSG